VLGTSAALDPELLREAIDTLSERIVVALDVKGNDVMVNGWKDDVGPLEDFIPALTEAHAPRFLITQINVDGTMEGPDLALYRRAVELTHKPVIASGGVHTIDDLRALPDTGVESVVVGKALLEGTVSLEEALAL
jgi:phosphoribosylformimino-5-aminoimidazole carboxamide ribonucleotide (ProFAR) isomerase